MTGVVGETYEHDRIPSIRRVEIQNYSSAHPHSKRRFGKNSKAQQGHYLRKFRIKLEIKLKSSKLNQAFSRLNWRLS